MIKDCMEIFDKKLQESGDALILGNYVPKDGTYYIVTMYPEKNWEISDPVNIRMNKKKNEIEGRLSPKYEQICFWDYYSKLIDMNKAVDSKKVIHSNQYLAFFVKKESLINGKLTEAIIDGYYKILEDPYLKYKSGNVKKLYQETENIYGEVDKETLNQIAKWIKDNIFKILENPKEKDYLKLFFVLPENQKTNELYVQEGERYLIPNIYNNNKYNIQIEDEIYGMPNNNMQLNEKKPYLPNHSRKISTPYLLNRKEVLLQAKFYDYLNGFAARGIYNIYFDMKNNKIYAAKTLREVKTSFWGYYLRIFKGKNEAEILHVDTIVAFHPNLKRRFYYKNILECKKSENYGSKTRIDELEALVDEVFFGKSLVNNYFTDPGDMMIRDGMLLKKIIEVRERFFAWFHKNTDIEIKSTLRNTGYELAVNSIRQGYWNKAKEQLNLMWSFDDYFNNNKEAENRMNEVVRTVFQNLDNKEDWEFLKDEEYYFAVGQMLSYFIQKSKAAKIPMSLANPILNAKKDDIIKKQLGNLFKKYNYDIGINDYRVKNLYGHIMLYHPVGNVNAEMISAGLVLNNLLYKKKEEDM